MNPLSLITKGIIGRINKDYKYPFDISVDFEEKIITVLVEDGQLDVVVEEQNIDVTTGEEIIEVVLDQPNVSVQD